MMRLKLLALAAIVGNLGCPLQAGGIQFTSQSLPTTSPSPGQNFVEDFDSPLAEGYSWTGFNRTMWSNPGNPLGNLFDSGVPNFAGNMPGNQTRFGALFAGQAASLSSLRKMSSLSVDIGSIDDYNFIDFYDDGTLIGSITGSDLTATPNGAWSGADTNRRFFFVGGLFNKVTFWSAGNSLEIDNIATSEVSEPAILALVGLGFLGVAMRRRFG